MTYLQDAVLAEINSRGGIEQLRFVLNTHWHGDHTGNNATLGHHATIIAHDNVRQRLSVDQAQPFFNSVAKAQPKHALPTITYPQNLWIQFNGDRLTLQHYANSHTDGDTVIFFEKANIVHMGDQLFYPAFPFIDLGSGGNAFSYADNVNAILTLINTDTVVIPGHGPVTNKKGLEEYADMLQGTIAEVMTMKEAGLSLEQAQAKGLDEQWRKWTNGFIKPADWISFIYGSNRP